MFALNNEGCQKRLMDKDKKIRRLELEIQQLRTKTGSKVTTFSKVDDWSFLFHGAMLPLLLIGSSASILFMSMSIRTYFWWVPPALVVLSIIWTTIFFIRHGKKAVSYSYIRNTALACIPSLLLSEKGLGLALLLYEEKSLEAFVATLLFGIVLYFLCVTVWVLLKFKTKEAFQAFIFVWFWSSLTSSIALLAILMLAGFSPFFAGFGSFPYCELYPYQCTAAPIIFVVWIGGVVWIAWRLVQRAKRSANSLEHHHNK